MTETVRKAESSDLPEILGVYAQAREFMAQNGNPSQWGDNGYPDEELLDFDIRLERLYVIIRDGRIAASFVLFIGDEPTYRVIRGGAWPNDKPYMTIHRLAALTCEHGTAKSVLDYAVGICREKGLDLRADTHRNNAPMLHILKKYGFAYCGEIKVGDGTPRMAFQLAV